MRGAVFWFLSFALGPVWEEDELGNEEFYVRNGQCWELSQIPVFQEDSFRQQILQQC
jgi:hypothetical protein